MATERSPGTAMVGRDSATYHSILPPPISSSRPMRFATRLLPTVCLLFVLGCGGPETGDRGVTPGSGTVDTSAKSAVAGLSPDYDWPMWRGADGTAVAAGQSVPTTFGPDENVVWDVPIPGHGHSSPTIVGDRIYLATADDAAETQSVLALDRATGDQVWTTEVHSGGFPSSGEMHAKSSHASCTVACDGERLFVAFLNHDAIHVTALDLEGDIVWQKEAGAFESKFGYAPSPTLYKSSVIVAADNQGGGHISSFDRATGELNWRIDRPKVSTYASPVVRNVGGRDQLLIAGAQRVTSYDPVTGEQIWSVDGVAEACVGTAVVDGDLVIASGGYPQREILAVDAKTGEVAWRKNDKSYVPSLLAHDGYVYMIDDKGTARCYDAATGDAKWQERLGQSGDFSASPVLADGRLYTISERGECFVIAANPDEFEVVAQIDVADEAFASPVVCGGRIYLRVADKSDGRQERLYCFGEN